MPREKINDPDTEGLYVQVNWRAHDEIPDSTAPGHVQISTHNERADAEVTRLLTEASRVMSMLGSAVRCGEPMSTVMIKAQDAWADRVAEFRAELTGTYVTLTPETIKPLLRTIHKAERQTWPPSAETGSAVELAVTGPLPVPGATGYPLVQQGNHPGVPDPALTPLDVDLRE